MLRITLTLIVFTFFLMCANAQSAEVINKRKAEFDGSILNKNALYFSLGGMSQSLNFETNFANTERSAWCFKMGAGLNQEPFGSNYQHLLAGITYLSGRKRKSHFELSAGAIFMLAHENYKENKRMRYENQSLSDFMRLNPTAYMGYRYQKPGGHFIFRYGFGYPEISAISFGYAF